jgi:hypothetical protein
VSASEKLISSRAWASACSESRDRPFTSMTRTASSPRLLARSRGSAESAAALSDVRNRTGSSLTRLATNANTCDVAASSHCTSSIAIKTEADEAIDRSVARTATQTVR